MSSTEVILNLPPILQNAANTYKTETLEYNAEILSQCSTEDKDVCSNSVSDFPMISIVNSSDVIIGSVTQFHGPVTIVQQQASPKEGIEDKKNEADMVATDYKTKAAPKKPAAPQHCLPKRLLICFAVLTLLITLIALSVILMLEKRYDTDGDVLSTYNFTNQYFYTVTEWGGKQPLSKEAITNPVRYVIIVHTAGVFCNTFLECAAQVQLAQDLHVTKDEPNIKYNFVIGGDGNIYEGRGWSVKNSLRDDSISVAFIGNFIYDELLPSMLDALLELIESGRHLGVLPDSYRIVAHNQTAPTLSPGRNVYKVIKELAHFYPDLTPVIRN
uniref:Peptidoglycan-recognition protein SC1 n=1 Tax=Holotrichia parallela TaxID=93412 RepID=A0A8F9WLY5_HOLPA|nr:peptidoglycan-recognition protein SC1 [Holotrichia parallela]